MASRPKVFATKGIPPVGMEMLKEKCDVTLWPHTTAISKKDFMAQVQGVDAILCHYVDRIDKDILDAAGPSLKVVSTYSVGYDLIDLEECRRRNIRVGHTPNVLSDSVAELAMALLLTTSRRITEGIAAVKEGAWSNWEDGYFLCGPELVDATVGIVGLGRIGTAVARRLQGFGVAKILYYDVASVPWATDVKATLVTFDEMLEQSDFIIACCSSNESNWNLFNKSAFEKMKKTSIFVNVTRGKLVNQEDLYEALTTGQILAAGLDATTPEPLPCDHKLLELKNCVITPHIGSSSYTTRNNMAKYTAHNILAGIKGEPLAACANP